jgi:putative peptide zinc metalloprotease protein
MDAFDLPNLHGRSFALARWKLREFLFGLGDEPPESFSPSKQLSLILFAWATWIYRLVLFLGIALLVYYFFFKLLGIFLFCVEIIWFIVKPLNSELKVWKQLWPRIRQQRRSQHTAVLVGICLILLALPWPGRISVSSVLRPIDVYPIYAPAGARIDALPFQHGSPVSTGQAVIELYVPELKNRQKALQLRLDQQRFLASTALFDDTMRKNWQVAEQSLNVTAAELDGVRAEQKQFIPVAPFDGQFLIAQPDVKVGQWVSKKEQLALIVSKTTQWRVETWIDEEDVARLEIGQSATFHSDSATSGMLRLSLAAIDKDASRLLPRKELSSALGGHILTREKNGQLTPERSVYRVIFNVEQMPEEMMFQSWRGQVVINANWQIPIQKYIRHAASVFFREAGF